MSKLTLSVSPANDLVDVPRRILVSGAAAGELVLVTSQTMRADVVWRSHAYFIADVTGHIDLSRVPPVSGDYSGVAPMGLLWSQRPVLPADVPQRGQQPVFHATPEQPLMTTLQAQALADDEAGRVSATLVQRLTNPDVTRHEVREDGLVGTLFLPPGPGPHPAVMVLNGSGGGINAPRAALLAARGYAAFALGYFKVPGLPDYISNTPLELFARGIDWLRRTVRPLGDFVALSGQSRGGELVLLLAATYPEKVSAVLAYVPSALVHSGQSASDPAVGRDGPAWLLNGQPIRHQWQDNRYASWQPYDEGLPPQRHALAMLTALRDMDAVARARIPVERIQAPVLLLSAGDDGAWPSSIYCRMISDALRRANHPYPVQWHDYQHAGHSVLFPCVPTTQSTYVHPVSGRLSTLGGEPHANSDANRHSWQQAQEFLREAVKAHLSRKEAP